MKRILSIMLACLVIMTGSVVAFAATATGTDAKKDEAPLFMIKYETGGAKVVLSQTYHEGDTITLPDGEATGYHFGGWYEDANLTKKFSITKMPAASLTAYGDYALNLSTFEKMFKDADIDEEIKSMNLTPEAFDKLASSLGIKITYTVNGKEYTCKSFRGMTSEIAETIKNTTKYGDIVNVNIKVGMGGLDEDQAYSVRVYNDIPAATNTDADNDEKTDNSGKDTKTDGEDKSKPDETSWSDVPDTGSGSTAIFVVILICAICAAAATFVVIKKKGGKEDTESTDNTANS